MPKQLPLDLGAPAAPLAPREVDVTVKDVGGGGYTGNAAVVFTEEGATPVAGFTPTIQFFDPTAGSWQTLRTGAAQGSFEDDVPVTVPASGQVVVRFRVGGGSTAFGDLKVLGSANGANVTGVVPATKVVMDVSGLPAGIHAGVPVPLTVKLTNGTDVDYSSVETDFVAALCDTTTAGCPKGKDLLLEVRSAGSAWRTVPMTDLADHSGSHALVLSGASLAHGAVLSVPLRLTLPVSAPAGPARITVVPNVVTAPAPQSATVIAAPLPSAATRTPQASASTATSSASTDPSAATPTDSGTATATDPATGTPATPAPSDSLSAAPAAAPTGGSGSNATVLLAVGLLVLCGGLVGGYFYLQRRGQV